MLRFHAVEIRALMYYVCCKSRNQIKAKRQKVLKCVKIIIQYFQSDKGFWESFFNMFCFLLVSGFGCYNTKSSLL